MRAVLTRVKSASVSVDGNVIGQIGPGFLILLGITHDDTEAQAVKLADKLTGLRIFEDEDGKALLTWEFAEKGVMWGMLFLFAGGLALGSLVTETGAALKMAEAITLLPLTGGLETVFAFTLFSTVLTEISSNTAAAAIAVPVVQSIAQALGLNPIPYLFVAIVAFNSAYVLPVSIRAIPVSYGLDPAELFKNGLLLSLCSVLLITVVGYLFIRYWPLFSTV